MTALLAITLLAAGIYATLLGFGKVAGPAGWRNREETLWIGRFSLFFGILVTLACFGITTDVISGWIQDIFTSGGGAGTG